MGILVRQITRDFLFRLFFKQMTSIFLNKLNTLRGTAFIVISIAISSGLFKLTSFGLFLKCAHNLN